MWPFTFSPPFKKPLYLVRKFPFQVSCSCSEHLGAFSLGSRSLFCIFEAIFRGRMIWLRLFSIFRVRFGIFRSLVFFDFIVMWCFGSFPFLEVLFFMLIFLSDCWFFGLIGIDWLVDWMITLATKFIFTWLITSIRATWLYWFWF